MRAAIGDLMTVACRSVAMALATCVAVLPLALLANYWTVTRPHEPLVEALAESLAESQTSESAREVDPASPPLLLRSVEKFNDCLIPLMSLLAEGSTKQLTVSAQRVYSLQKPQQPCRALEQRVALGAVDPAEFETVFYHQYWNGNRVPVRALVPVLGVDGYRHLLRLLTYCALALALLGAVWRLAGVRLDRFSQENADTGIETEQLFSSLASIAATLVLLVCFDLHQRAASFASAVAMLPCFWLWAYWQIRPPKMALSDQGSLRTPDSSRLALVGAVLGCWVAYFSLLTGSILLGVILLAAAAALAPAGNEAQRKGRAGALIALLVSFCTAVVGFLATHLIVAQAVFENNIFGYFVDQLMFRINGSGRSTMPGTLNQLYSDHEVSLSLLWQRLEPSLSVLALGSPSLGRGLFFASQLIVALGSLFLIGSFVRQRDPWRSVALTLSGLAVPLWGLLFLEHTQVHVRLMSRFLAWPIAVSLIVLLMLLIPRFRRHHFQNQSEL